MINLSALSLISHLRAGIADKRINQKTAEFNPSCTSQILGHTSSNMHVRSRKTPLGCSSPTCNWPLGAAVRSAEMSGCFQKWKSVRTVPVFSLVVSLPSNLAPLKSSTSRLGLNIWKVFRICRALLTLGDARLVSGNTGHTSPPWKTPMVHLTSEEWERVYLMRCQDRRDTERCWFSRKVYVNTLSQE